MILASHFQQRVFGQHFARFGKLPLPAEYRSSHDERLRAGPAVREIPARK